jgi:hypothetical protein
MGEIYKFLKLDTVTLWLKAGIAEPAEKLVVR